MALQGGSAAGGAPHEDEAKFDALLSSPTSTPMTRSPESQPFTSLADQTFTPVSFVDDQSVVDATSAGRKPAPAPAGQSPAGRQRGPSSVLSGHGAGDALDSAAAAVEAALDAAAAAVSVPGSPATRARPPTGGSEPCADQSPRANRVLDQSRRRDSRDRTSAARGRQQQPKHHPVQTQGQGATRAIAGTAPSPVSPGLEHGHIQGRRLRHEGHPDSNSNSHSNSSRRYSRDQPTNPLAPARHASAASSPLSDFFPLHTGSVQPDTRLAQPRPIIRTNSLAIRHPIPDLSPRSPSYAGSIAQLEATAERLSMTSSIDDAIRGLHSELKRSDSRRSSRLAASVRGSSADDNNSNAVGQLSRHLSNSSSILSTKIAARHGGYSPAAFVKSPSHSLTGRLRSGSKNSSGRPDLDFDSILSLSRHGPGKASVRSVRSNKMSLAEISESEPIALNKDAFDKADSAPPIRNHGHDAHQRPTEFDDANNPNTDPFQNMMGNDDFMVHGHADQAVDRSAAQPQNQHIDVPQRPGSAQSTNTFQQCQDAFGDFDGVHWVPEHDFVPYAPSNNFDLSAPPMPPAAVARPQPPVDESGQPMLYYPARVPAMLNLPPKLSNKPKASERNNRRSKILSVMMDDKQLRQGEQEEKRDTNRDSFLPDPLAGQRNSFAALSTDELNFGFEEPRPDGNEEPSAQSVAEPEDESLRRPERLSQMDPEKRKSKMARLSKLPPQLRASAFFDIPSVSPEVQVKDGSAMATLDSILDASTTAPVSAFTDHSFGNKLGNETYGKQKKRASMGAATTLRPTTAEEEPKKKSSFSWFKRGHKDKAKSDTGAAPSANADDAATSADGVEPEIDVDELDGFDSEEEIHGPPTTLLAELQMRKQQQRNRTQMPDRTDSEGMYATLLEMDAVAETQQKARQGKRVNLAWEDPDAHLDQNGSDDEDVPLALLAAKNAGTGTRSMLDVVRPLGLMEKRELEENEPLSHRRARLNGQDPRELVIAKQRSMTNLAAPITPRSRSDVSRAPTPPDPNEVPGETLAERRRRLAAKDEAENPLPRARAVSSVFSAELLSQFGDLDDKKETDDKKEKNAADGEETLGQRRRRLQSEREAREREMGHNNLDGTTGPSPPRRLNMADVLGAHPKRDTDFQPLEEKRRKEEEKRRAKEQEAKMAVIRSQMPTTLTGPNLNHAGGFRSGQYNDGTGGLGAVVAKSSPALRSQTQVSSQLQHRASAVFNAYGTPMTPQQVPYGGAMVQPGMPVPLPAGSMDRVEQWRQSVLQ